MKVLIILLFLFFLLLLLSSSNCEKWTQTLTSPSSDTCNSSIKTCNNAWHFSNNTCTSGSPCDPADVNCYSTQEGCMGNNVNGYRCSDNCAQGAVCGSKTGDSWNTCHGSRENCLDSCIVKPSNIADCGDVNRERGWYDFSHFNEATRTFSRSGPYNDYCRWVNNGAVFSCKLFGSSDEYSKNPDGTIKNYGVYINNPNQKLLAGQTNCPVITVFDRINNNENILYKLFNNGKTLQGISASQTYVSDRLTGSISPELFWRLVGSNSDYLFYNKNNECLICLNPDGCQDDVPIQESETLEVVKIRIVPIDRANGTCNLQSLSAPGWLSVDSSNNLVKVISNQSDPSAVWTIVPYSLNKVRLL